MLESMDKKEERKAIELGFKDPLAEAVEDREHNLKMKMLREKGDELKRENDKLLPIGLIDHSLYR